MHAAISVKKMSFMSPSESASRDVVRKFDLKQRACFISPAGPKSLSAVGAEGIACSGASDDGKQACRTALRV